jgi:hypothetical protein
VTDKGISVVGIGGNGTKGLNRYVVDITYNSSLPWFWKEHKAVNVLLFNTKIVNIL